MSSLDESFPDVLVALAAHYGRPDVSLGRDRPFTALAASILAGGPDPRRASAAAAALAAAGLLEPPALAEADAVELREALREGGVALTPRAIAPLLRLARWLVERHQGSADRLRDEGPAATETLREELRSLNGIGPATADALLLFALGRVAYPLDRATYRVLVRHGWLEPSAGYDEGRDAIENRSPDDPTALARLSAWMERLGRDFCRASVPKCDRCPLLPFLPEGGPVC